MKRIRVLIRKDETGQVLPQQRVHCVRRLCNNTLEIWLECGHPVPKGKVYDEIKTWPIMEIATDAIAVCQTCADAEATKAYRSLGLNAGAELAEEQRGKLTNHTDAKEFLLDWCHEHKPLGAPHLVNRWVAGVKRGFWHGVGMLPSTAAVSGGLSDDLSGL